MNKQCYRIIFSRTQGELRVVSELASSCSTQPGQRRGTGVARLWVTVRPAVWLIGMSLFAGPLFANGIVADGQLAPNLRPEVISTQNGVPQVNINAPNQAGVSHNQYQQFDVGQQGAILNNSAVMTSTQLGGYIEGNARLNPNNAPARVIINEVNSNNPSQLRGFLEVAGGKAQVIVANPSGIVCDGCGTINAGRMTLTTGKPQLNADGSLAGYQVERGLIRIEGGGLNGDPRHDTEYTDILARAVQVNAGVWAREGVSVVAGRNQISADGKTVAALAGSDNTPEMAIDMGQMGGMYSGYIRMVGTEAGVGVRNQGGHLQADKTLTVSSEGKLIWQAGTAEPFTQAGGDITLAARDSIEHHGQLYSGGQLNVQSQQGEITQSGTLAAAGDVSLRAEQGIHSSGHLLAGSDANSTLVRPADLTLESRGDIRASGSLMSQKDVKVSGRKVDLSQSRLVAGHAMLSSQSGDIALNQAKIDSQQFTVNSQGNLSSEQAEIRAGRWQINADSLFNQGGIWSQVGAGESRFALTGALDNTDGSIEAQQLDLNTATLNNLRGRLIALDNSAQHWRVAGLLTNQSGLLGSNGSLQLDAEVLDNQQGKIHSGDILTLNSAHINNRAGQLVSSQSMTLNGDSIDNSQSGIISSQAALTVNAGQLNNRDGGLLIGTTHTDLNVRLLDNTAGRILSADTLALSQLERLDNRQGTILSNNDLSISGSSDYVPTLLNQGGNIQSDGALTVMTQSFDNQGGTLLSQRELTLTMQQDYTHRAGDTLSSNTAVTLRVAGILTNLTDWLLPGDLTVFSSHLTNLGSLVSHTLHVTTGTLRNQGRIEADTLTLDSDNLDNQTTLMADNLTVNSRVIDNYGREALIAATQHISLMTGERLTNRDGALIYSGDTLQLSSGDLIENRASNIEAERDLTLTANRFDNLREGLDITREAGQSEYDLHFYNYYWRSYGSDTNIDVSTVAPTTQHLTFRDDAAAASNPYGTLLNIDATAKRAEVRVKNNAGQLINLWVNYLALVPNADGSYAMTFYDVRGWNQDIIPTPYQNSFRREHDIGEAVVWDPERFLDIAAAPGVSDYNNLRDRSVTGTVTTDKLVSAGIGAFVLSGGNMVLHIAGQLLNDASTISANGDLTIDGTANIINQGYSVNERRQEYIVDHYDRDEGHWYPTFNRDETTALTTIDGVISGNGNVSLSGAHLENTTVSQAQISSVDAAQHTDEQALTDQQHLPNVATHIPDNALFRQQTSPASPYLVVTDPRFANKSNFISSDYMLQRVGYDPGQVHKRLGDGYYEQHIVREQLLMLTGRPSLQGEEAMAQYQSLMNNGIKAAEDFHLMPGVALAPAQIAALQQDIVWLVSESVETAEGPQTVWVPKVYLANNTVRLTGDGAVIAGNSLQLSTDSVSNAGNLFADKALSIDTGKFQHTGGDIRADSINVQANSISLSTNLQDALRQASMSARDITLSGGDISLQGARLSASDNLSLSASNTLNIGTARSSTTTEVSVISGSMGNRKREGLEEAGERMAQVSGEWQQALGSSLTAGGNLSLQAGQDITLQGSEASAGGSLGVLAGGNVSLLADTTTNSTHLDANSRTSTVSNDRRAETLHTSALSGNSGVTVLSGGNFVAEGARVESTSGGIGLSAQQVTIKEARQQLSTHDSEQSKVGKTQSERQEDISSDTSQGSLFSAKDGVTLIARQGDITVQGSTVQSEKGTLGLKAAGDISLTASRDEYDRSEHGSSSSKGTLSSSQSAYQIKEHNSTTHGSLLSGQEVVVLSGRDINVIGSALAASDDIALAAANNITVGTAQNTYQFSSASQSKKSGFSGTGGIGVSYGTNSLNMTDTGNSITRAGSTIGSTTGNVTLNAGNNLTVKGSDVLAGQDINLIAKEVSILAADNQSVQTHTMEQKQSGLTLALSGAVGSAISSAVSSANDATTASTGRLAALDGMKSALGGVQAYQGDQLGEAEGKEPESLFGLNLSYGSQSSKSEQTQTSNQSQGSTITAGNNLNIRATDTDINVQGSQLQAGKDIELMAGRDVNLWSGVNTSVLDGKNESHGSSVGVGFNIGEGNTGFTINASANKGKGSESGNGLTHSETTLNAGNSLNIVSDRDTTLTGAQLSGDSVTMDVGRNLTLTSQQDSDDYDSKQQNASGGVSGGFGSFSASASISQDKMHSTYDSVQEQTGIFAGKGGFDIRVSEHTQLNGAVIGSTSAPENNRLDTGTLGFGDIGNRADYEVSHLSTGMSTGGNIGGQFAANMASMLLVGVNGDGSDSSTTKSAVSDGSILIRDTEKQTQNVSDLSRDVEHANQTLSPIFDKEKEQQRLQEAQKIGEIGSQAMDIARTQGKIAEANALKDPNAIQAAKEVLAGKGILNPTQEQVNNQVSTTAMAPYGTGSDLQRALQAATALAQGLAGGNLQQAAAGAASPYVAGIIHDMTTNADGSVNLAANAMVHAVWGAIAAQASGNSALAGASGAAGGELMARYIAEEMYPGVRPEDLSEEQKQTLSALGTLAAGLAGGLTGDSSADAVAGAQAGQNAVENNYLSFDEARAFDKAMTACKASGGNCDAVINKYEAKNKDNRDELQQKLATDPLTVLSGVDKWNVEGGLIAADPVRPSWLYGSLDNEDVKVYILNQNGYDLNYIINNASQGNRALAFIGEPENTWGLIAGAGSVFTSSTTLGNKLIGAGMGYAANGGVQLMTGDKFDYVSFATSGVTGAGGVGKSLNSNLMLNVGNAYFTSQVTGQDSRAAMMGAAAGTGIGFAGGSLITSQLEARIIKDYFGMSASSNAFKYTESSFGPGFLFKGGEMSPIPGISGGAIGAFGQEYSGVIINNKSVKKEAK